MLIFYCVLLYFIEKEKFTVCGDNMSLDDDANIVKMKQVSDKYAMNTVYGDVGITNFGKFICEWTFKILSLNGNINSPGIGIGWTKKFQNMNFMDNKKRVFFGCTGNSRRTSENYIGYGYFGGSFRRQRWKQGDIIKMKLKWIGTNSDKDYIEYFVNDVSQGRAFLQLNLFSSSAGYLAISLGGGDSVQLMDFKRQYLSM